MIFHSSFESIYLILPLIGFVIGLFGTMFGGGGGFFFLPVLTLIIGAPAQVAVATSLAATIPICLVGTYGHYRSGNVDVKVGSTFIIAGLFGAVGGALLTGLLSSKELKIAFGVYSIIIALNMSVNTWKKKKTEHRGGKLEKLSTVGRVLRTSFYGIFGGAIAGTFGTSGTAPVLAGLFSMRLPIKVVVGTSLAVVMMNAIIGVTAHFVVGQIDLSLVAFLTAGSILGALLGTKLIAKSNVEKSENNIRHIYALVMLIIGVLMILK